MLRGQTLDGTPACEQVVDQHDHSEHKQQVNQASAYREGEPQDPQQQNDDEYSPENTYVYAFKTRKTTVRVCRTCRAEYSRRYQLGKKAAS